MNLMLSYFKCSFQYSIHTCMIRDLNDSHLYSKRLLNISADDLLLDCVRKFVKIFAHFRTSFSYKIGGKFVHNLSNLGGIVDILHLQDQQNKSVL